MFKTFVSMLAYSLPLISTKHKVLLRRMAINQSTFVIVLQIKDVGSHAVKNWSLTGRKITLHQCITEHCLRRVIFHDLY